MKKCNKQFFQTDYAGSIVHGNSNFSVNNRNDPSFCPSADSFFHSNRQFRADFTSIIRSVRANNDHMRIYLNEDSTGWVVSAQLSEQIGLILWTISSAEVVKSVVQTQSTEVNTLKKEIKGLQWLEKHLTQQQNQFELVEKTVHVGHWIYDCLEDSFHWSDELYRMFNWNKKLFTSGLEELRSIIHPEEQQFFVDSFNTHLSTGIDMELECRIVRSDSSIRTILLNSTFEKHDTSPLQISCTVVRDITSFKKLTEELEESSDILNQISSTIQEFFCIFERQTEECVFISDAYSKIYQTSIPDIKNVESILLKGVSKNDTNTIREAFTLVSTQLIRNKRLEYIISPSVGEKRNVDLQMNPIYDETGSVSRIVVIARDITREVQEIEEQKHRDKYLLQADRMQTLSTLVSGVAHEINNPNNLIMLNGTFLMKLWQDVIAILDLYAIGKTNFAIHNLPYNEVRTEFLSMLQSILNGSDRIKAIVASLKQFAGVDSGAFDETIHVQQLIERTELITSAMIRKANIKLHIVSPDKTAYLKGNAQQLQQVLVNLITNAYESFQGTTGTISISVHAVQNILEIIVRDSGSGISPEIIDKIMNPFFTTRREWGNEGLGLTVAYGIITAHGGSISFNSEIGVGTTVTLSFPIFQQTVS